MNKMMMAGMMVAAAALNANGFAATPADYKAPSLDYTTVNGTYNLDTSHASVIWKISHLGYSNFAGRFNKLDATAKVDGKNLTKSRVS